jgi:hypothetical protein
VYETYTPIAQDAERERERERAYTPCPIDTGQLRMYTKWQMVMARAGPSVNDPYTCLDEMK